MLVWDDMIKNIALRWRVCGALLGHSDSVVFEMVPFFVETQDDIVEAKKLLGKRIKQKWNKLKEQSTNDEDNNQQ